MCGGDHWNSQCTQQQAKNKNADFVQKNFSKLQAFFTQQNDCNQENDNTPHATHAIQGMNGTNVNIQPTAPTILTAAALLSALGVSDSCFVQPPPRQFDTGMIGIPSNTTAFVLDSGCTHPLVASQTMLENYTPALPQEYPPFITGTGEVCHVTGTGTLHLTIVTSVGLKQIVINDAKYCEKFTVNLMPEKYLVDVHNIQFHHDKKGKHMTFNDKSQVKLRNSHNLHWIDCMPNNYGLVTQSRSVKSVRQPLSHMPNIKTIQELHNLFGHRNYVDIARLAKENGWKLNDNSAEELFCETCAKSKFRSENSPKQRENISQVMHSGVIVSVDYIGPYETSIGDFDGAYVFLDWFSKMPFVYPVRHKSDFLQSFKKYLIDTGLRINNSIHGPQILQSDTSSDVYSPESIQFCIENGIRMRASPPYSQEQNGIVERAIQTLKQMTAALLLESKLPEKFWRYAMSHAATLIALIPKKNGQSPYEAQYNTKPKMNMVPATFGSKVIIKDNKNSKSKFTSTPGVTGYYVGNSKRSKSYLIYMCNTNRIRESNQVLFPTMSSYKPSQDTIWTPPPEQYNELNDGRDNDIFNGNSDKQYLPSDDKLTEFINDVPLSNANLPIRNIDKVSKNGDSKINDNNSETDVINLADHFVWAKTTNDFNNDKTCTNNSALYCSNDELCKCMEARFTETLNETHTSDQHETDTYTDQVNFSLSTTVVYEDYRKAKKDPKWESCWSQAHSTEIKAMLENNVFDFTTDVPTGTNIVDSKMIYSEKYNTDGEIAKWKARMVAKGYTQRYGIDYFLSFAPTPMDSVWRILLIIAACFKSSVKHFDISTAFLSGDLEETIYMRMPAGMRHTDDIGNEYYAKLNSPIYGLKQSARKFYEKLTDVLVTNGYIRSSMEPCLYMKDNTYAMVYVDDILVCSSNVLEVNQLEKILHSTFKITGGDDVSNFLGMKIHQSACKSKFSVSQQQIIEDLADKFPSIRGTRHVKTPLPENAQFNKEHCVDEDDRRYDPIRHRQYRQIIGTLLYCAGKTRMDIQYAISKASTVMSAPGQEHFDSLWHIFRYVYHSREMKMIIKPIFNGTILLDANSDSDWARDIGTRKSTSGCITRINGSITSAKTKTQSSISQSAAEAEMIAASLTCKEIVHQRRLLNEMGFPQTTPTLLNCDSKSVIDASNNPMVGSKLKHVQISNFWCRELIDKNIIQFRKVSGLDNLADMFTKPIVGEPFRRYRAELGIVIG